jgi:hypothetical protein
MMMHTHNNTAPAQTDTPQNVTFDDDSSNITEVFNDFNLYDDAANTNAPISTATNMDTGGYFACPTTSGIMKGHIFFYPSLMAFFQHCMPQYPIAQFRTYAEAEDFSHTTIYPPYFRHHQHAPTYNMPMFNSPGPHMGGPTPVPNNFHYNQPWPPLPETCLPNLAFTQPPPTTPYQVHTDPHVAPTPSVIVSPNQPTPIHPMTVYLKEDSTLKPPTCPEDPKDFPAYEKKVRASLQKINMHHLLDDGTMTTERRQL